MEQPFTRAEMQTYITAIQDDRPCRQCEMADFTVTDHQPSAGERTAIKVTCGVCGWNQAGTVANAKIAKVLQTTEAAPCQ